MPFAFSATRVPRAPVTDSGAERNFLPQARQVALTNLSARVTATSAVPAAAETDYSQHQRSLLALAEVMAAPAPAGQAVAGVDTHARDFLDQPQSP